MKHKKLFRSVTALLAALVLMGGFSTIVDKDWFKD